MALAKSFVIGLDLAGPFDSHNLADEFARTQGYQKVERIVLGESIDSSSDLLQAAGYHSCAIAVAEAVWGLIHSGYLLPFVQNLLTPGVTQAWSRSGHNASWTAKELSYSVPQQVTVAPSLNSEKPEHIADPDLYVLEDGIEGKHADVGEALRDSVYCLRAGLYRRWKSCRVDVG